MTAEQIALLFSQMEQVAKQLEDNRKTLEFVRGSLDTVINAWQQQGTAIEYMRQTIMKLAVECPVLHPTGEHQRVCAKEGE